MNLVFGPNFQSFQICFICKKIKSCLGLRVWVGCVYYCPVIPATGLVTSWQQKTPPPKTNECPLDWKTIVLSFWEGGGPWHSLGFLWGVGFRLIPNNVVTVHLMYDGTMCSVQVFVQNAKSFDRSKVESGKAFRCEANTMNKSRRHSIIFLDGDFVEGIHHFLLRYLES